jgi:iron-sulfur cluster repair protein YtfE (RIC family)
MNAIELLKKDHEKVKKLCEQYDSDGDRRRDIANMVFEELEIHSRVEEDVFYPAVRAKAKKDGKELIKHSIEEHQEVDDLINALRSMDPEEEDFDDRFQELIEDVEYHIDLEESETFPKAEQLLGNDLEDLGKQIEEEKETVKAR